MSSQNHNENDSSPAPIRWGIVGLGDVTLKKSGPPFYKCVGSELVAVMRRSPGKAAEWAERVPGGQCVGYDDLDLFLQHQGLDAVYIATPPESHLELVQKVAQAGIACYVEKPVGRCAAETRAMVECFAQAQRPFYTAYISRAYPRTQKVRDLIQREQILGDRIVSIDYTFRGNIVPRGFDPASPPWRVVAEKAGGGEIMDIGCHVLDRIDYLCGPLIHVQGSAQNKNSPDQLVEDHVQLEATIGPSDWAAVMSEGTKVRCEWDFSGLKEMEGPKDELILTGSNGVCMKMVGMTPSLPIFIYDKQGQLVRTEEFDTLEHTAQPLIQAVTDDLRGVQTSSFISRGDNALRTSQVLDQVLESFYGKREIGYWNRPPESWPGRQTLQE